MPKKSPADPRFHFEDNCLSIYQKERVVYNITIWPKPFAESRGYTDRLTCFYPEFRVIDYPLRAPKKKPTPQLDLGLDVTPSEPKMTKKGAYDQLRQSMPFSYAIALAPFKSHQWHPLIFLSMKRRFYDLLKSSPVLAYLLANDESVQTKVFRKQLMLDNLIGMKQAELLNLLGFPSTKAFAQIFRKITPTSARPELTVMLRNCLDDQETTKKLAHLQKINLGTLTLLTQKESIRQQVTPQLLEEVSHTRSEAHYAIAANRLSESVLWHHELRSDHPFPPLRTRDALTAYHEEITAARQQYMGTTGATARAETREAYRETIDKAFRAPPIPGTDHIQPLETPRDLINEGYAQHNCVGAHADRVRAGTSCVYRILEPERATVSIIKASGGEWHIDELLVACNKPVKTETCAAVKKWLSQTHVGI